MGLPWSSDRTRSGQEARQEEGRHGRARKEKTLPGVRRKVSRHPARGIQEAWRPRRLGLALPNNVLRLRGNDSAGASGVRKERRPLQRQKTSALVPLVHYGACRG